MLAKYLTRSTRVTEFGVPARVWFVKVAVVLLCYFFSSRRRHTRFDCDWSSDVCSSDLRQPARGGRRRGAAAASAGAARRRGAAHARGHRGTARRRRRGGTATDRMPRTRLEERRVGKEGRSWWLPVY